MSQVSGRTASGRPTAGEAGAAGAAGGAPAPAAGQGTQPLPVTGLVGAAWCVGIGLAVLTTITLVGWIAAPRTALGPGLPGVFRTAVTFWLVAHHAGFSVPGGRVGLLPLGLTVLPGALLYRSGGWMIRAAGVPTRTRVGVVHVALALAVPYTLLAGLLALVVHTPMIRPSAWQALIVCFLLALVAGGMGAARALVAARGKRVRSGLGALLRLLPDRPRSVVMGVVAATAVLLASGAILVGVSLATHLSEARSMYEGLAPGIVGGLLLLLIEVVYLPNAVIFGMAYAIGPGFSVGAGTSVSSTGVFLGSFPAFPPLAALPAPGPAPALSLIALAVPFVAGAVGGTLTIRAMPSPVYEAAPLWGFLSGALTGCLTAVLGALAGGPMGGGRLATVGPSAWQVGLMAALEVGVSAAIAAWIANWMLLRPLVEEAAAGAAGGAAGPAERGAAGRAGKRAAGRAGRLRWAGRLKKWKRDKAPKGVPVAGASEPSKRPESPAESRWPEPQGAQPVRADALEFVDPEPVLGSRRTSRSPARAGDPDDLWAFDLPDVQAPREREPGSRGDPGPGPGPGQNPAGRG